MDWLVDNKGECEALPDSLPFSDHPYRLYRFLTDLEDILEKTVDDRLRIKAICPLVRRLLISSDWIQLSALAPDPELGWAVQTLYDEPDFPLTVQLVSWVPNSISPIHNHGTWGIVAMISGEEKNTFWQRVGDRPRQAKIKPVGARTLTSGEIIGFMPHSIHSIQSLGDEPTISFNIYGETDYSQRFEFNIATSTARLF